MDRVKSFINRIIAYFRTHIGQFFAVVVVGGGFMTYIIGDLQSRPKASFIVEPLEGLPPLSIQITNRVENNDYIWHLGDEVTYVGDNPPTVTFATPGTQTIELRAVERNYFLFQQGDVATVDVVIYTHTPSPTVSPTHTSTFTPTPVSNEIKMNITYDVDALFIYVEPPLSRQISLDELKIVGNQPSGRLITLGLDTIFDPITIGNINEPKCLVVRVRNSSPTFINAPQSCNATNAQYSVPLQPILAPWRDALRDIIFESIVIQWREEEIECGATGCEITYIVQVEEALLTPTQVTPSPTFVIPSPLESTSDTVQSVSTSIMLPLPGVNASIDREMIHGGQFFDAYRDTDDPAYWDQRVRDGELNIFGDNLRDLPSRHFNPSTQPDKPVVDEDVHWFLADAICKVQGKRLPTIEELKLAKEIFRDEVFLFQAEWIEWTNTPYFQSRDNTRVAHFYEIWVQDIPEDINLNGFVNEDGSGFNHPAFTDSQTIPIGFRCAIDN